MTKITFNSQVLNDKLFCNYKDIITMTVSKQGRQGLYFKAYNAGGRYDIRPTNNELLFRLEEKSEKFSNYKVTVTYHDEGHAHFCLFYKNSLGEVKKTELVELSNTNEWKSHTFCLEDLSQTPEYSGFDFAVSIYDKLTGLTKDGVTFGEILVDADKKSAPVKVKLSTPEGTYSNFFKVDSDNVNIIATFKNISEKSETVKATFSSTNALGENSYSESFDLKINSGETIEKVLKFAPEFSVFDAIMTVENDSVFSTDTISYSYILGTTRKNEKIGINSHSIRLDSRKAEILAPWMKRLGFSAVREGLWQDFTYGDIEGATGPFAPSEYHKSVIDTYHKNNLDWMQLIIWESRIIYWAYQDAYEGGKISDPENEEIVLNFIKDSSDYTKKNSNSYEFLNECNMHRDENGKHIYPGKWYAEFLKRAYPLLKELAPDHPVVAGVTSYIDFEWLGEMFDHANGCFDSVSIHPYTFVTGPDETFEYTYYGHVKKFRDFMNEKGLADKPITITEVGFPTQSHFVHPEFTHTKLEQAAYMTQLYNIYQTDYLNIDKTYFYDFQCDGANRQELEDNLGIFETWHTVEYPYLAKPAAVSMSWMNEALTDAEYVKRIDEDNLHLYHHKRNDENIIVLWAKEGTRDTQIKLGSDYKVYDMFGNELSSGNDKLSLTLDYMPKYIIGEFDDFEILK